MYLGENLHNEVLRHIVMVNYSAKSIIIAFNLVLLSYRPQINGEAIACASASLITMWGGQIFYTAFWTPWYDGGITNFFRANKRERVHYISQPALKIAVLVGCIMYYFGFAVLYIVCMLNSTEFVNLNPILTACTYATVAWHFYQALAFIIITALVVFGGAFEEPF